MDSGEFWGDNTWPKGSLTELSVGGKAGTSMETWLGLWLAGLTGLAGLAGLTGLTGLAGLVSPGKEGLLVAAGLVAAGLDAGLAGLPGRAGEGLVGLGTAG